MKKYQKFIRSVRSKTIFIIISTGLNAAVEGQPQVINQPDNSSCNELPPVMNTISFYCSAEPSYSPSRNVLSVFHGTFSHFLNEGGNAELYSLFRCVFSVQTKTIQKTTYIYILGQARTFPYVFGHKIFNESDLRKFLTTENICRKNMIS